MADRIRLSSAARFVVVAALVAASGCAARHARVPSPVPAAGEPAPDGSGLEAAPPPAAELQGYMRKVQALQSRALPKNSLLPTIESNSPALSRSLLILALHESAEGHRVVAAAYRQAGVLDYAYRHYQRAAVMEPCDAVSYDGMARLWRDWGMPDVALTEVYRALHCDGRSAAIYNTLGTILESLGQPTRAHRAYEQAVERDPKAGFALNNLCYLEMSSGHAATAADFCERALAVSPDMVAARNNLALVKARSGDLAGAEARLRTGAINATSLYNVGVLRLSERRYAEAATLFARAAMAEPTLTIARQRSVQARKAALAEGQPR